MELPTDQQDREILDACKAGDEDGWRRLFKTCFPLARWAASSPRYGLGAEQAEDIAQQVMIDLCPAVREGKVRCLTAFVRTLTHNRCVDFLRKKDPLNARNTVPEEEIDLKADLQEVSMSVAESEALSILGQMLEEMGSPCSQLLTRRFYEGLSYKELADLLTIPSAQVGMQIKRCIGKLKTILESSRPALSAELAGLLA